MATYGKKKRSILPSFSTLRDSVTTQKSRKEKAKIQESSSITNSTLNQSDSQQIPCSQHDDSIDELASLILNDTSMEDLPEVEPGKRLSRITSMQPISTMSSTTSHDNKSLPQLPQLFFNGDDAWAMKMAPVVTAAGGSNEVRFGKGDEIRPSTVPAVPANVVHHVRKASGPPIPRKSSKRRSVQPKKPVPKTQSPSSEGADATATKPAKNILLPLDSQKDEVRTQSAAMTGVDINKKIAAMLAATDALKARKTTNNTKPTSEGLSLPARKITASQSLNALGTVYEGPFVQAKKRRLKDNKVLVKVKTAINERLHGRSVKKRHDSLRDDRLLDDSLNELPDYDDGDGPNTPSMWERRMNEGNNLQNPKIQKFTGHGIVTRKPITDEGRSLKSRQSVEDPFSERPPSSGITRIHTSFDNRLKDDMSIDERFIPDSPSRPQTPKSGLARTKVKHSTSFETRASRSSYQTLEGVEFPSRTQTPKSGLPRARNNKNLIPETDFDALFSSSPLAQSTPRIRLEPTMEDDGKRTLKSVPADLRSVFDSDMDIDTELAEPDVSLAIRFNPSSRMKKHPSPSKTELEGLERALRQFGSFPKQTPEKSKGRNALGHLGHSLTSASILGKKDGNARMQERKARNQGKPIIRKSEMIRTTESMPEMPQSSTQNGLQLSGSMMDIDELQWDESKYDIGLKRL